MTRDTDWLQCQGCGYLAQRVTVALECSIPAGKPRRFGPPPECDEPESKTICPRCGAVDNFEAALAACENCQEHMDGHCDGLQGGETCECWDPIPTRGGSLDMLTGSLCEDVR